MFASSGLIPAVGGADILDVKWSEVEGRGGGGGWVKRGGRGGDGG